MAEGQQARVASSRLKAQANSAKHSSFIRNTGYTASGASSAIINSTA